MAYDYWYTRKIINNMIEFLLQNLFFAHTKICAACIYSTGFNLKLIKDDVIKNQQCVDSTCFFIYSNLLLKCLKEVRYQKYNISYFFSDFQNIFNQKLSYDLYIYNRSSIDSLDLNIDNYLNLLIAQGMKVISDLHEYNNKSAEEVNIGIIDNYLKSILNNSLKYFYSSYTGFSGKEKKERCQNVSSNIPLRFLISVGFIVVLICIFSYYITKIHNMIIYFLDRI